MSNKEAATVYEEVINEVINESRQDFEDLGIDEATLQDLRSLWRENLGKSHVAQFSWMLNSPEDLLLNNPSSSSAGIVPGSQDTTFTVPGMKKDDNKNGHGAEFSFEVRDENGQLARTLQKQREAELKKERTMASLDSDDINSDLDDSDDEGEGFDEDGEDGDGMIMLCLYEKVLRVKNKWKCNLKDGLLNVNGRDYAFHKATGESEW